MPLAIRSTPLDLPPDVRPIDVHLTGLGGPDRVVMRDGEGFAAWGTAARLDVDARGDRYRAASAAVREFAGHVGAPEDLEAEDGGLVALGSFTFSEEDAGSVLVVPVHLLGRRGGRTWLTTVAPVGVAVPPEPVVVGPPSDSADRVRFGGSTVDDVTWLGAVDEVLRRIGDGAVEKVVLARDQHVWMRRPFDLHALVHALAARFPACTTFRMDGLVGASPEPLLSLSGRAVASRVLAGTAPRSPDPVEDDRLGAALLASPKDRHEHALAVASVRDRLAGAVVGLGVAAEPRLLHLANVQHLATDVTATVAGPTSSLELVGRIHPTAAVGGTPRAAALTAIREVEGMARGRYAGPVGWTCASGDGEWALALRCGMFEATRGRLFAGAGIVAGSRPESELTETWLKLAAVRDVLAARAPEERR